MSKLIRLLSLSTLIAACLIITPVLAANKPYCASIIPTNGILGGGSDYYVGYKESPCKSFGQAKCAKGDGNTVKGIVECTGSSRLLVKPAESGSKDTQTRGPVYLCVKLNAS